MFFGSVPSSHFIADKELETEKRQFMVFSGVIVLVYLREVGFALSLLLCGGGWGVFGLRVGKGWVVLPCPGESLGLSF